MNGIMKGIGIGHPNNMLLALTIKYGGKNKGKPKGGNGCGRKKKDKAAGSGAPP